MTITLNFTGRRKLPRDFVSFALSQPGPDGICSFEAKFGDITSLGLPAEARVFVEPYVGASSMRFDYGCVGTLVQPEDRLLTEIDQGRGVLFRVIIVDATGDIGKIVASSEANPPAGDEESRDWVLPLVLRDLGETVWDLEDEAGSRPRLVLNSRYPGIKERLLKDPLLMGAIFPIALHRILTMVIDEDDDQPWYADWRRFTAEHVGEDACTRIFDRFADDTEKSEEIRNVCERFLARRKYLSRAVAAETGASNE